MKKLRLCMRIFACLVLALAMFAYEIPIADANANVQVEGWWDAEHFGAPGSTRTDFEEGTYILEVRTPNFHSKRRSQ